MAQSNPTPTTPAPTLTGDTLPRYTASGAPVTRAYRIAFQAWMIFVLLSIVATLVFFLIDKVSYAFYGR